ncbi:hypothetical protein ACFY5C_12540 [Streptomyces sp. NPDC012935]|uniref:hypothetical protein n=1 Tax=Streptomyces sp. NPDC012935 TaxID=3364857 RepID=UPI00368CF542
MTEEKAAKTLSRQLYERDDPAYGMKLMEPDEVLPRLQNFNDRYSEEQRADFSLTRITVARPESPGVDDWTLPTGLPPTATGTARRAPTRSREAA